MFNVYAFLAYIFITAYTPGPNNIMSMSIAGRYGFKKSMRFNLGILCGFSAVMALCTLFSAALYSILPAVKPYMLVVGALYMLYLAWKTWKSPGHLQSETAKDKSSSFVSGMLLQFVNVKVIIYGITAMSSYILPNFHDPAIYALFALLLCFVGFSGTLCWSAFGSLFSRLFMRHTKLINAILALLLVYCAVSLFF